MFFSSLILGLVFIVFSFLVTKGVFLSVDHYVDQTLPFVFNNLLYLISRFLAYMYVPLIAAIVVLAVKASLKKQKTEAMLLMTSFSGGILAEFILKPIFNIPCPQNYYSQFLADQEVFGLLQALQSIGFFETCYPSSHVATYVVFGGYLSYLVLKYIKEKQQRFTLLGILYALIALVGPSRLYLHVHWLSDVIGGYLLGFSLLALIISAHRKLIQPQKL